MAVPRMIALAQVLWSPKATRNEGDFIRRLEHEFINLDSLHVHYSKSLYNVGYTLAGSKKRGQINVSLAADAKLGEIHYTVDSSDPVISSPQFFATIEQRENATIKAALFRDGRKIGNTTSRTFAFDKGTGRVITTDPPPSEKYGMGGAFTLIDGVSAQARRVNTEWLGWTSPMVMITVDLGEKQSLTHVGIGALEERYSWIHLPKEVIITTSMDGVAYTDLATVRPEPNATGRTEFGIDDPVSARFVRFMVKNHGTIEPGFAGAGKMPWFFLDEIHIR